MGRTLTPKNPDPADPSKIEYDWISIKKMYVEGYVDESGALVYPSALDIAKMFYDPDLVTKTQKTIQEKSNKNKWGRAREQYQEDLDNMRRQKMMESLVKKRVGFDMSCLNIAEAGLGQIKKHFMTYQRAGEDVPTKDLHRLAGTLHKFQISGRLALGETPRELEDEMNNSRTVNYDDLSRDDLRQLEEIYERAEQAPDTKGD